MKMNWTLVLRENHGKLFRHGTIDVDPDTHPDRIRTQVIDKVRAEHAYDGFGSSACVRFTLDPAR